MTAPVARVDRWCESTVVGAYMHCLVAVHARLWRHYTQRLSGIASVQYRQWCSPPRSRLVCFLLSLCSFSLPCRVLNLMICVTWRVACEELEDRISEILFGLERGSFRLIASFLTKAKKEKNGDFDFFRIIAIFGLKAFGLSGIHCITITYWHYYFYRLCVQGFHHGMEGLHEFLVKTEGSNLEKKITCKSIPMCITTMLKTR